MHRLGLLACAAVCGLVVPEGVSGQRLGGSVRETGSGAPVAGAVVSVLDSAGHTSGRTITDATGRYSVTLAPSAKNLRVVRIGFRPVTLPLAKRAPSDTSVDVAMDRIPFLLATVRISSDATCGGAPNARAALELWEQARAALLTAIVAREANPAQVANMTYDRRLDIRDRRVTQHRVNVTRGTSRRPFVAARPAAALAAEGYMQWRGLEQIYYAPDADVMFDDSFAGEHCFGVQVGSGDHRGQIGLTFVPRSAVGRDRLVDVGGTLWLDSIASALVQLEFKYTGVDSVSERAGSGGTLHFQSMSNGVVFIDEWTISLPVLKNLLSPTSSGGMVFKHVVTDLSESGGVVLSAEWGDGSKWTGTIGAIRGRITERGTSIPVPGAGVSLAGVTWVVTDNNGQFSFGLLPPGRYDLEVLDSTFGQFLRPRKDGREAIVAHGDTVEVNFEVAARASLIDALCKDTRAGPETSVLLGHIADGTAAWPKALRVESTWQADFEVSSLHVGVSTAQHWVEVDDGGRFFACGVARGRPIRLRALLGKLTLADTVLGASDAGPVRVVEWNVRPGLFTTAQLGDGSSFSGQVVRAGDGAPIADAEVWIVPGDLGARTDSAGQFRFVGLKTGPQVVQVRRIGYAPRRDTVTLRAREETVRQIALSTQETLLDTVRTTGTVKYFSPRLQGFEERRARAFGRFIPEAELRKHDIATLSSILATRIPGIRFVNYRGGTIIGSTRGGKAARADPSDRRSPVGCWVNVYIDGMAIYKGPPDLPPDMARLQVVEFGGIEHYPGGASLPPEFNSITQSGCGVLLLWTRER